MAKQRILITATEKAVELGVSLESLRRWRKSGNCNIGRVERAAT